MPDLLASLQDALTTRYRLEDEIGRGGMAVVFRAQDLQLARTVAVKVLSPDISTLIGEDRFRREIAIAARLQHPNIVALYESGGSDQLVWYTMPLIEGETLRARIEREKQLPLGDALRIAIAVAEALKYAHQQGVVHRDIKPENILLSGDQVLVADFGIARAISAAGQDRLTSAGIALGTPAYMSPEQSSDRLPIDGRADIYALGCVLYEMLSGQPPFTGATPQAIMARHLGEPVPSLHVVRTTVPAAIEDAIERALAKVPADRHVDAAAFIAALKADDPVMRPHTRRLIARVVSVAILMVAVGLGIVVSVRNRLGAGSAGASDTSRYAILPFEHGPNVDTTLGEDQLMRDALGRWSGIQVVDQFLVRDAMARRGDAPLRAEEAKRIAVRLGAGRYVRGDVSRMGDSLRVHAGLYDGGGALLADSTVHLPAGLRGADSLFAILADRLLFRNAGPGGRVAAATGTRSAPARQAFARGYVEIQRWNLAAADSAYAAAITFDAEYAEAFVWLAQVRWWAGLPVEQWRSAAERAAVDRAHLAPRDRLRSDALLALGRGDVERACRGWRDLARRDPADFASLFSLANCLSRDEAVLPDRSSPSSWRFRTSYHEAIAAYEQAFHLLPSIHRTLRLRGYEAVRRLLKTSPSALRRGFALAPDTMRFGAYPAWQGDTLAFVPYPQRELLDGRLRPTAEALGAAIRHERERFRRVAAEWVASFPRSPDALEAMALALEMLGNPAALDTMRHARSLATSDDDRVRLAAYEVWMRVRFSVPADPSGLVAARVLADSVVRRYPPPATADPILLASIAALLGRAGLAAQYARHPSVSLEYGPPVVDGFPLLALAALGGPEDSLFLLEQRVQSAIDRLPLASDRADARDQWLSHPATLALPAHRFRSMNSLADHGDWLLDAQLALLRGDTATVRRALDARTRQRNGVAPAALTLDGVLPEALLMTAVGNQGRAAAFLDSVLVALPLADPYSLADPSRAGPLVRAMVLRADLAEQAGDRPGAARWAGAVIALWSHPDPFLDVVTRRMRRLAER